MGIADDIKHMLTSRQVAEHYGLHVGRAGVISCPFHKGDRTPSLKLYDGERGWYCFGCGRGGSVINFVMELFGLNFQQAVLRINADFNLGLSNRKPTRAEHSAIIEARKAEQREREREEAEFWQHIRDMRYYREIIALFRPIKNGGEIYFHPFYAEAVKRLPYIEYWLDDTIERGGRKREGNSAIHAGRLSSGNGTL